MTFILTMAAIAASAANPGPTFIDVHALMNPVAHQSDSRKNPRKFEEVVQPVQYDGQYSPPPGRYEEPQASPTTPVRYLQPWERALPVIVKPAPEYISEEEAQARRSKAGLGQAGNAVAPRPTGQTAGAYAAPAAGSQQTYQAGSATLTSDTIPGPLPSAGSATGSTATADYGSLPQ